MNSVIAEKITEIAERVGSREGIEIVEVQLLGGGNNRVLRIFIDKPEGVTHGDCETISLHVGTILDVEDVIPGGGYRLEVSSPGVERKLSKPADFERFSGKKAKITLREPINGSRRFEGILGGVKDGMIHLEVSPENSLSIPLEQIEKANLKFEW